MKSKEFIKYYNLIDEALRNRDNQYEGFAQKVRNSTNNIIRRNKNELLSYAELRNAIVHHHIDDNAVIAEPHPITVTNLKRIYEQITNPKRVHPTFKKEVAGAKEDEYINNILQSIKEHSFSQFPVFNAAGQVVELINTNTIARWLASKIDADGIVATEDTKVSDFVSAIEHKQNYQFSPYSHHLRCLSAFYRRNTYKQTQPRCAIYYRCWQAHRKTARNGHYRRCGTGNGARGE